jgi:hypothetical protein
VRDIHVFYKKMKNKTLLIIVIIIAVVSVIAWWAMSRPSVPETFFTNTTTTSTTADDFKGFTYSRQNDQIFYTKDGANPNPTWTLLPEADSDSFVVIEQGSEAPLLNLGFAMDVNHVYAGWNIVPKADPATFKLLRNDIAVDKRALYRINSNLTVDEWTWADVDPIKYSLIPNIDFSPSAAFLENSGKLYVLTKQTGLYVIPNGDPASLVELPFGFSFESYAKDKNNLYCNGFVVKGADAATARVITERKTTQDKKAYLVIQDKDHIYDSNCRIVQ